MLYAFIFISLQNGTVFSLQMMRLRIRGCGLPKFAKLLIMVDFDLKSDCRSLFRETISNSECGTAYRTNDLFSLTNQFHERKKKGETVTEYKRLKSCDELVNI